MIVDRIGKCFGGEIALCRWRWNITIHGAGGGAANLSQNTMSLNHCSWQNQLQPSGRKSKYFLSMFPTHTLACPPISTKVTPCTLHKGGKIIFTIKLIWFVVFLDKVFEGLRVSSHQPAKKTFLDFFWIQRMNRPNVRQN